MPKPKNFEIQFIEIIRNDRWLMRLLSCAASLQLETPWAIAAGAVRSSVWDYLHGFERKTPPSDIDFIFFDRLNTSNALERDIEHRLSHLDSTVSWEAVNQATVHDYTREEPYSSIEHAMMRWAETATAIGVYLDEQRQLKYYAPHGLDDLMNIVLRPHLVTPKSKEVYLDRVAKKNFQRKWPQLKILMPE
jgi:hypothetical protein